MDTAQTLDPVFDVTTAQFDVQVLQASARVPVVVDFWASWCAPCRMLAPVLEKAVRDMGGRVRLARVDTDREPELASRYRISGIPAVKAFRNGQVVDEFVGARDARFVRAFLERVAPSEQVQQLEQAAGLLRSGRASEAEALLRQLQDAGPRAPLLLAEAILAQGGSRLAEVPPLLAQVDPRSPEAERAEQLGRLVEFFQAADEVGGLEGAERRLAANPGDLDARFGRAAALARASRYEEAFEALLQLVQDHRTYRDDGARRAMVTLFDYLGPDNGLVHEWRRRLQVFT
ncbi:MAG: tetratricopeptide repeat protein [Myxococcales bacterium]|nr:tetratricopeptide repeat protein [Myxococcota bacterium]MDW8280432.1 tetratricopeptide repeat protein [Myxococcales bacterium]